MFLEYERQSTILLLNLSNYITNHEHVSEILLYRDSFVCALEYFKARTVEYHLLV